MFVQNAVSATKIALTLYFSMFLKYAPGFYTASARLRRSAEDMDNVCLLVGRADARCTVSSRFQCPSSLLFSKSTYISSVTGCESQLRCRDAVHARRHPHVDSHLHDDFDYLLSCDTDIQGGANVEFQLTRRRTHGGQRCDRQHLTRAKIDAWSIHDVC